jgi:hypothetical protein
MIRSDTLRSGPTSKERVMSRLSELLAREEVMEKQCSRVEWLQAGDCNIGFFHAKARQRARTNKITALRRHDGSICTDQTELENLAAVFYHHLFSAQENSNPEEVVRFIPDKVTDLHNELLCSPFTEAEIRVALFMMKPNEAPGPDGFTTGFYQGHWNLLGNDICRAVLAFLNGGSMPDVVNDTILVLIPKVKNPQELT